MSAIGYCRFLCASTFRMRCFFVCHFWKIVHKARMISQLHWSVKFSIVSTFGNWKLYRGEVFFRWRRAENKFLKIPKKSAYFRSFGATQNPLVVTPYGFDPHHRHQSYLSGFYRLGIFCLADKTDSFSVGFGGQVRPTEFSPKRFFVWEISFFRGVRQDWFCLQSCSQPPFCCPRRCGHKYWPWWKSWNVPATSVPLSLWLCSWLASWGKSGGGRDSESGGNHSSRAFRGKPVSHSPGPQDTGTVIFTVSVDETLPP